MHRLFFFLFLLLFATPLQVFAQKGEQEELQFLIIETLTNNPDILAAVHNMRVFEQKIPQASALDDPQLTLKWMEIPGTQFNQATYANLELMQMIRFPTKLGTARDIAAIQAEHAHHDHLEKILEVIAQLKSSYAMLWNARTILNINLENQNLLNQILKVAQIRYAVATTSQQEVLKTNIELAKLKVQGTAIRQEVAGTESMLRAILNRPANAAIGPLSLPSIEPIRLTLDDLLAYALSNRPMLLHDSLSVVGGDLQYDLARQEYIPDARISLEYVTSPALGHKRWTIMAGISIPFAPWTLSKASARVQEALAQRSRAEAIFRASKNMVAAQIRDSYAKAKAFETEVLAFQNSILPQTEQSLKSLVAEYQTGQTSYLMLLDTYRMYQETKMQAAMAMMKYQQALAMLERHVGVVNHSLVPKQSDEERP